MVGVNRNPVVDSPERVAATMLSNYFLLIPNKDLAKKAALIAVDYLIDSWDEDHGAHFAATKKCWQDVRIILQSYNP